MKTKDEERKNKAEQEKLKLNVIEANENRDVLMFIYPSWREQVCAHMWL